MGLLEKQEISQFLYEIYKERYGELKKFKPTQKHLEEILYVIIIKNLDLFENS